MPNKRKTGKWIHFRHRMVRSIAYMILYPYSRIRYGIKIEKFKDSRQCLVLFNHQTAFDQFFVGMAFKQPIYYVASEDIFSKGWISSLIRYLVAPIPIKKQTTDVRAVMNCIQVAREGGSIALAPEGNRTYSGRPVNINPAIAPLARKLGLPILLYRIEGGYGVQPRWADNVRRGKMRGYVSSVIEPSDYAGLTNDELYSLIVNGLNVDETLIDGCYYHKKAAEGLERVFYVCPKCGLSTFKTKNDVIKCDTCGISACYTPKKELCGIDQDFPYRNVADWYDYQCGYISDADLDPGKALFEDDAALSEVIVYKSKKALMKMAKISLFADKIIAECEYTQVFDFDGVSAMSVLGRNKVNIYCDKRIFQIKGNKHFNALKYVNLFYCYKNHKSEAHNGEFLGL